jgi:putative lipase involved disintegration of autophagic bodies
MATEETSKFLRFNNKDWNKFVMDFLSTLIAVFLALLINLQVISCNNNGTYNSELKAIKYEAAQNKDVLQNSFTAYNLSENGIVYRNFDVKIAETYMNNEIFISHAPDSLINLLSNYIAYLKRTNLFREADLKYKYDSSLNLKWRHTITEELWKKMIGEDSNLIVQVVYFK